MRFRASSGLLAAVVCAVLAGCSSQETATPLPPELTGREGFSRPEEAPAPSAVPRNAVPPDTVPPDTAEAPRARADVEDASVAEEDPESLLVAGILEDAERAKEGGASAPPPSDLESVLDELIATTSGRSAVDSAALPDSSSGTGQGGLDIARAKALLAASRGLAGDAAGATAPGAPSASPPAPVEAVASAPSTAPAEAVPPPAAKPEPVVAATATPTPAESPAEAPATAAPVPKPPRPAGLVTIRELYHKTADEFIRFARETFPEWLEKGHVTKIEGKARSVLVCGDTPDPADPITKRILAVMDDFDDLELKLESRKIRPRYVDVSTVMNTLVMRGLANIWQITEEVQTSTWKVGDQTRTAQTKALGFRETGLVAGAVAPIPVPPKIPYVYEVPSSDPFDIPKVYNGNASGAQPLIDFKNQASTEERGVIMAVGTYEDLENIQAFIDSIDMPARQIMIEVQVVQLEAKKLTDLGIDSVQFGQRHTLSSLALPLPGEKVTQPGFGDAARRSPDIFVPDITQPGWGLVFDDTAKDLSGRFMATLHALVREGDATVKARPKILTLDDRQSILHIGRNVPVFKSTGVTRDATVGTFVSEVNNVDSVYVGFSLNIRPRVSGGAEDEVAIQVEVVVNELGERQRVFAQDLLGIPEIIKRQYVGQMRVKNHRPIILGGLIQEQETSSANKIPILGDIPLLGYFFRRSVTTQDRQEVILVLTPHVLSDKGVDRASTPKESIHFDTFDSVLFNDMHIIKGRDVIGIDPMTGNPTKSPDGKVFTEEEVVDLTLLNIVKERELVSKLGILDDYIGAEDLEELGWIQRRWPEATVSGWTKKQQELYFRAAAIVLENIKELNPDLTYEELVVPRREIVLPTTPYRISLSYDKVKALQTGYEPFLRGEKVEMSEKTIGLLRDASGRSLREFADFLDGRKRKSEDHGDMLTELLRLYNTQNTTGKSIEGARYSEIYRELAAVKFDFVSLATYFRENLTDRYLTLGPPNVGEFERDLKSFIEASVTLHQRAKKLMELNSKWELINSASEEDDEASAGLIEGETPIAEE